MSKCRGCGREIVWIKTRAGWSIPCDPGLMNYWSRTDGSKIIITPKGEAVRCELEGDPQEATGVGYVSHFATCPDAAAFRRR